MSVTIATGILMLGGAVVWGLVVLRLAAMGTKHPEHQGFYIKLARSKKLEIPNPIYKQLNDSEEESKK